MRNKIKVALIIIFFLILAAGGLVMASGLKEVKVKGNIYYTDDKLKDELKKYYVKGNTILTYLRLKYDKSITIPFVDEIDVDLTGLHSIVIDTTEKEVVGCLPFMGEFICFDKDGIMVGSIPTEKDNIPVVTGIIYDTAVFNKPIAAKNAEVFELTLNITQLIKKYGLEINRIEFGDNLSIKLYEKDVKILLGRRKHFDEQISNLVEILPKTKGMKGTLHMEDFSETNKRVIFEADK